MAITTREDAPKIKHHDVKYKVIGTRPIRHDGVDKVTGAARYGADVSQPGQLYGVVVRSPHAHARIRSIDVKQALAVPGVHAVITSANLPEPGEGVTGGGEEAGAPIKHKSANMLARDKVLYHGHAVAAVAATDAHVAGEAADLVEVDYEVLPPVMDVRTAMAPGATLLHDDVFTEFAGSVDDQPSNVAAKFLFEEGDVEAGFAAADVVVDREFTCAMVHQGYIENHNALALWHGDGELTVWCSSQGHFTIRSELADILDWPISKIKVIPTEIGGGFGGKTTVYLEPLAAALARVAGRPVKMTMPRADILKATGPTPGAYMRVKMGATKDGKITAAQAYLAFEAGGFPGSVISPGCQCVFAPFKLTNVKIEGFDVVVNRPKTHAYRAPGATQAEFASETVADEICEKIGVDPLEFRELNAAEEGDWRADGPPYQRIGHKECILAAKDSDHWNTPLEKSAGTYRGRGVASGFWFNVGLTSSAIAKLNPDGTVTLLEGSPDIGGTRSSIAMQFAETLGLGFDDIIPLVADTDSVGFTDVTGGSRVTFATGYAAHEAAKDMREQMVAGLADVWDVDASTVVYENAMFSAGDKSASFKEAAGLINDDEQQIIGKATITPNEGHAFATHIADVEVDVETGKVSVLRYTAIQDAGVAIYPPYVEGQMQGGAVQGIGWAFNEEYVYDVDGRLRNVSLLDYRMPTALDIPMIETIIVEVPHAGSPFGVRGVGEVPIVPPPATLANAVYDAVGIRFRDLPMAPHRVQASLAKSSNGTGS